MKGKWYPAWRNVRFSGFSWILRYRVSRTRTKSAAHAQCRQNVFSFSYLVSLDKPFSLPAPSPPFLDSLVWPSTSWWLSLESRPSPSPTTFSPLVSFSPPPLPPLFFFFFAALSLGLTQKSGGLLFLKLENTELDKRLLTIFIEWWFMTINSEF